jgi:uncharacterized protein (DUF58 family)
VKRAGGAPARTSPAASTDVLRRLELTVIRRLDGFLHGDHQGLVPGAGSEPGEARVYTAGDDVRRMDWAVTARTQVPHVRDTIADRELETWIVADLSASLTFGTARLEKRSLALAAAAAVGFVASRAGNRVGAVALGGAAPLTIPARAGRQHLFATLQRLDRVETVEGAGPTDLAGALESLARTRRPRGLVVVVSDFLAPDGWARPLQALHARHEVLAVEVVDPRELELPAVGLIVLVDPETGRELEVQTGDRRVRERFGAAAAEQRQGIARTIRAAGADHLVLRTDRDWVVDLVRHLAERRRRRATGSGVTAGRSPGAGVGR